MGKIPTTTYLTAEEIKQIGNYAQHHKLSKSATIRNAIKKLLEGRNNGK